MIDREKVIKAVEEAFDLVHSDFIGTDGFNETEWEQNKVDALALLNEQTHGETFTVIDTKTGKEADEYNIALYEDWAKHLCYCDMEGWAIENDGTLLLVDECGRFAYADRERFKVVWDA